MAMILAGRHGQLSLKAASTALFLILYSDIVYGFSLLPSSIRSTRAVLLSSCNSNMRTSSAVLSSEGTRLRPKATPDNVSTQTKAASTLSADAGDLKPEKPRRADWEGDTTIQRSNSTPKTLGGGKYAVQGVLGTGSTGSTYRCVRRAPPQDLLSSEGSHQQLRGEEEEEGVIEEVAVKVLTLRGMRNWKQLDMFQREAKVLKGLRHPGIPRSGWRLRRPCLRSQKLKLYKYVPVGDQCSTAALRSAVWSGFFTYIVRDITWQIELPRSPGS